MKEYGTWWSDSSIRIVDIDGRKIALNGWNGETYTDCFPVKDSHTLDDDSQTYVVIPVYRFDVEQIDISTLEENSPEWDNALEVVDYDIV